MAHDNYDKFYTWDGGTLVLDPGVFAFAEPRLERCNRVPFNATGLDRVFDSEEQKFCAKPMRLMSSKHRPLSLAATQRCDTIIPGRSYCCPPYVMPTDWRVDYLPLGDDAASAASQIVEGATEAAEGAVREVGIMVEEVSAPDLMTRVRSAVQARPLTYLAMGFCSGVIAAKLFGRRG